MTKKKFALPFVSLIAGIILVGAFAPFHGFLLAFAAAGMLLYCWKDANPKMAWWCGLCFGIGLFGAGTSWIYNSIHNFGNANVFEAAFVTILFTLFMSLYPAMQGYCFRKFFHKKSLLKQYLLAFPLTWVIFEGLRTWLFTGFSWVLLGYSQTGYFLDGYAPLFSVFGVSFVVSLISGALLLIAGKTTQYRKKIAIITIIAAIIIAIPLHYYKWTHASLRSLSVALVQGNIPQNMKWDAEEQQTILRKYLLLTAKHWQNELIVWPEAAIPVLKSEAEEFITDLNSTAKQHNSALIFGIPIDDDNQVYNGIMVVGNGSGIYYKQHLVPFGEYTPLPAIYEPIMRQFNVPMSNLAKGPSKQKLLLAQNIKIAPFICYEITYPDQVARNSRDSQLLVVISDDSWFGNSFAAAQQLQMARLRAIETGRPILYVNNTDNSTIISEHGTTELIALPHQASIVTGNIYPREGNTPFMNYYFYPLGGILGLAILLLFIRKKY